MQAVLHGFAQSIVLTPLQRLLEREHTLHMEKGVCPRHLARQRRASLCRRQSNDRGRHHQPEILGPRPPKRVGQCPFNFNDRVQASEKSGCRVVRVPLGLSREAEELRIAQRAGDSLEHPEAGNARSSAAAKSSGHRNLACYLDRDTWPASSGPLNSDVERAFYRIASRDCWRAPRHHEFRSAIVADIDDPGTQVQLNGNTEGIEAATQVGNRAWDYYFLPDNGVSANRLSGLK